MAKDKQTGPLAAEDATKLPYVDQDKFYLVDLQFGSMASWRDWQGQPRKASVNPEGGVDRTHNPKVIPNLGAFSGDIVNGLIAKHNDWILHYSRRREKDIRGHLDRQILVLNVVETDSIPKDSGAKSGMIPVGMVQAYIKSQIQEELSTLTGGK
jgi:hypothetical protein